MGDIVQDTLRKRKQDLMEMLDVKRQGLTSLKRKVEVVQKLITDGEEELKKINAELGEE